MSTVMETPPRAVANDRFFYTGMAVVFAVIVFIGFSPTFFQRPAGLAPLSQLHVIHGIVYSAWLALLVTQTSLIAANRRAWHRALGALGVVLACVMLALGTMAAISTPPSRAPGSRAS